MSQRMNGIMDNAGILEKASDAEAELSRSKYEKLMLITEALWEIIKEENKYTDEKLIEKIKSIDLKDGKLDRRVLTPPVKCQKCNKTLEKGADVCIYCGTPSHLGFFER